MDKSKVQVLLSMADFDKQIDEAKVAGGISGQRKLIYMLKGVKSGEIEVDAIQRGGIPPEDFLELRAVLRLLAHHGKLARAAEQMLDPDSETEGKGNMRECLQVIRGGKDAGQ